MKNLIIVGAGPGLSSGVAQKFGENGYSIGLISRNEEKLQAGVTSLQKQNVSAYYSIANAYDVGELETAIHDLRKQMGAINSLVYNAAALKMKNLMDETVHELVEDFKISAANAFHCVQLLHGDLKSQKGSILLTGGAFAIQPNPDFGSLSLGKAALRNLAFQLNQTLKSDDIYVGTVTINGYIQQESETHSPALLAQKFWELHQHRQEVEIQY